MNGYAVHKDCSEGYPKEKGATKTGFSHLNKRMEMEPGDMNARQKMGRRRHNCYALLEEREGRAGLMLNAGSLFSLVKETLVSDIHVTSTMKKKVVAAGSIVKEMAM